MVNVAVLGGSEFIVGFQLAGIKEIIEASQEPVKDIMELKKRKDIGIVVVDEKIMESLDQHQKEEIEDSVDPVFIPLSIKVEQESLKRLIKQSIGVELWS